MTTEDPNELVRIKHSAIKTLGGPVTRQALSDIYEGKGWSEASDKDIAAANAQEVAAATGATDTTTTSGKDK